MSRTYRRLCNFALRVSSPSCLRRSKKRIITAAHEAVANALLWSNLELPHYESLQKRFEKISDDIQTHLQNPVFATRKIEIKLELVEGNAYQKRLKISIRTDGLPIEWASLYQSVYGGTTLMTQLASEVDFDQGINLYFNL